MKSAEESKPDAAASSTAGVPHAARCVGEFPLAPSIVAPTHSFSRLCGGPRVDTEPASQPASQSDLRLVRWFALCVVMLHLPVDSQTRLVRFASAACD
uniref:Uncharacterized protein n=1 Tax=Plectus sambesii TaxID=2011161 RepID=A0A914X7L0_9BILA